MVDSHRLKMFWKPLHVEGVKKEKKETQVEKLKKGRCYHIWSNRKE
jgi:hypothetical protein